jgi:8-amino-7-oxononanoate synthase
MLDFTSSLYLAIGHPHEALRPWRRLTSGVPAGLAVPVEARTVARRLASLQGCEGAILAPSTLHLFWDLFAMPSARSWELFIDAGAYAIATWGVESAAARGVPARRFRHYDPISLLRSLWRGTTRRRPVVVADGVCPSCGSVAPIVPFLEAIEQLGGLLVLDDTQALGIIGGGPTALMPFGLGGGGSVRRHGIEGRPVVIVASLAKGFGVPMAVMSGSSDLIGHFDRESRTRVHCSQVSFADLAATEHALDVNERFGTQIRTKLARLVQRFRHRLGEARIQTTGPFPVQTLVPIPDISPATLHGRLAARRIGAVLHRSGCGDGMRVSVLITAAHTPDEIDRIVHAIATAGALTETDS